MHRFAVVALLIIAFASSGDAPAAQQAPQTPQADSSAVASAKADAIVVGAGLSGLSAAVEMGRAGLNVLVLDMNSVPGGHAVLAGGVALVATPLQEKNGIKDSPDAAYKDWMQWTVDADPQWTRFYVENSRAMIYDWVTAMGVEFVRVGGGQANSVPRVHFTKGRSIHLVMPIFKTALAMPNVSFLWNAKAERLVVENGSVQGVVVRHLRTGRTETLRAPHTLLATGGFESDLERVLANWTPSLPRPDRLLIGSAISATGSGHDMAVEAGAALSRIDRHYIYIDGLADPRDSQRIHALTGGNSRAIWVNAQGRRFTNENGFDKAILADLLKQEPSSYWAVFDESARENFGVRGAAWVQTPMDGHPILDNPDAAHKADTLDALAAKAGLSADALKATIARFNSQIDGGEDTDFARFRGGQRLPGKIAKPPFYAVQFFPMTRKNMGGVAIDMQARVLNRTGQPVPGLFAAGEITGSVGINGSHGMDGTFLGPAIMTGRLAGRTISQQRAATSSRTNSQTNVGRVVSDPASAPLPSLTAADLQPLLAKPRDGFWHFEVSHKTVVERKYACTLCHMPALPFAPVTTRTQREAQTAVCVNCHDR
jgi:predicted oxidoreductase